MIGLVRNEWKKVFLPVLLTTVLLAIAMSVLSCTIYQNYVLHYDLEAWEVGTELFSLLYPLFVVVPLCWNLYYERKNNFLLYVMPRVKIKKYLCNIEFHLDIPLSVCHAPPPFFIRVWDYPNKQFWIFGQGT